MKKVYESPVMEKTLCAKEDVLSMSWFDNVFEDPFAIEGEE